MAQTAGKLPNTSPPWIGVPRSRAPFYVLVAGLLALVAGVLTYRYLTDLRDQALPSSPVLVARHGYQPGDQITSAGVQVVRIPDAVIPDGALVQAATAAGGVVALPISEGEIILARDLIGEQGGALAARLPARHWAMALPINWMVGPISGLEGGDRIDVVGYQAGQPVDQAGAIVRSVRVLIPPDQATNLIVLEVTETEAIALLYARANGFSLLGLLRPTTADS